MKPCPKCSTLHSKPGKFCSRICANSRGPRSADFKRKVSQQLMGRNNHTTESLSRAILAKGQNVLFTQINSVCIICNKPTVSWKRKTCSKQCYTALMTRNSQQNPNCGGQKHTHRSKITNNKNETFISESSYEVRVATSLNELNVHWIRPSFLWYTDSNGSKRRYYPDFYLPEHDLYLDPKNEYLIKTDLDKISLCSVENNVTILILGSKFLNRDAINEVLVGNDGTAPPYPRCKRGAFLLS